MTKRCLNINPQVAPSQLLIVVCFMISSDHYASVIVDVMKFTDNSVSHISHSLLNKLYCTYNHIFPRRIWRSINIRFLWQYILLVIAMSFYVFILFIFNIIIDKNV